MSRRWKIYSLVGTATLAADQVTKYWARNSLPTDPNGYGIPVSVIENFFDWRLSYNTGSAFGLFHGVPGAPIFLTLIGFFAIGAIFWMVKQAKEDQVRLACALGLVAGGAIGNVFDRLMFGKVTDFVVWKYYEHQWPTFNVADAALCVGVGLLFLDVGKEQKGEEDGEEDEGKGKGQGKGQGQGRGRGRGRGKKKGKRK